MENKTTIRPLNGYLLVAKESVSTESGIIVSGGTNDGRAEVIAVGEPITIDYNTGSKMYSPVKEGDKVIIKLGTGQIVEKSENSTMLIGFHDVIAIIN